MVEIPSGGDFLMPLIDPANDVFRCLCAECILSAPGKPFFLGVLWTSSPPAAAIAAIFVGVDFFFGLLVPGMKEFNSSNRMPTNTSNASTFAFAGTSAEEDDVDGILHHYQ